MLLSVGAYKKESTMAETLKEQGMSIVVLGDFNPKIFQPYWFSTMGLIRKEEADEAKIKVVHNDATAFSSQWFNLQVLHEKFSLETTDSSKHKAIRDLVYSTFRILEHSPITAFGFNYNRFFEMDSEEAWHALGDYYVPKRTWEKLLENPGMRSLTVEGKRKVCQANYVQIRLEPVKGTKHSVFLGVNEHYQLASADQHGIQPFLEHLLKSWDPFLDFVSEITDLILKDPHTKMGVK